MRLSSLLSRLPHILGIAVTVARLIVLLSVLHSSYWMCPCHSQAPLHPRPVMPQYLPGGLISQHISLTNPYFPGPQTPGVNHATSVRAAREQRHHQEGHQQPDPPRREI